MENIQLSLFIGKPKDMAWLLASKHVTHLITFETVVKNDPAVYTVIHEVMDPNISLAPHLLKRCMHRIRTMNRAEYIIDRCRTCSACDKIFRIQSFRSSDRIIGRILNQFG